MSALRIGDVATLHSLVVHPEFNGMQCIIRSGPYQGYYYIDIPGFESVWDYAHGRNLKKRPPTSDEATARQAMLDCIERARMGQGATA